MAERYDAVIIGGGHNGLVSAAYLARAGMKTLVLEQRHVLGGAAVTEELFPGFRFSVFSYVVSLLRPGDHPGPRAAAARARHPPARRDVHAAPPGGRAGQGRRRLPVARQRPRPDDPRAPPLVRDRRRGLRGIRPADGRDGPVHQADPRDHPAGPDLAGPAAAAAARRAAADVPAAAGATAGGLRPADDDERGRLPRPVVRDRPAEGDDERVRDHRDVSGGPLARHGLRPAPPLHGRDRRGVPGLGDPEGRDRRGLECDRQRRAGARGGDPDGGAGRADPRPRRPGGRRRSSRAPARRSAPTSSCPRSTRAGRTCRSSSRARSTRSSRRRSAGSSSAARPARSTWRSTGCRTSAACRGPASTSAARSRSARRSTRWSRPTTTRSTAASARSRTST